MTLKSTDFISPPPVSPLVRTRSELSNPTPQSSNPWLNQDASTSSGSKATKKANEVVIAKDSKAADKSKNKLKKSMQKRAEDREKAEDDAVVEISLDNLLTSSSGASGSKTAQKAAVASKKLGDEDGSDEDLEIEAQEQALALKGKGKANGVKAFEQRDLVALAFAGDNVVQVRWLPFFLFGFLADYSLVTRLLKKPKSVKSLQTHHAKSIRRYQDG